MDVSILEHAKDKLDLVGFFDILCNEEFIKCIFCKQDCLWSEVLSREDGTMLCDGVFDSCSLN